MPFVPVLTERGGNRTASCCSMDPKLRLKREFLDSNLPRHEMRCLLLKKKQLFTLLIHNSRFSSLSGLHWWSKCVNLVHFTYAGSSQENPKDFVFWYLEMPCEKFILISEVWIPNDRSSQGWISHVIMAHSIYGLGILHLRSTQLGSWKDTSIFLDLGCTSNKSTHPRPNCAKFMWFLAQWYKHKSSQPFCAQQDELQFLCFASSRRATSTASRNISQHIMSNYHTTHACEARLLQTSNYLTKHRVESFRILWREPLLFLVGRDVHKAQLTLGSLASTSVPRLRWH